MRWFPFNTMFNEYALWAMAQERLREARQAARRRSLAPVRPPRRSMRIRLGIGLIARAMAGRPLSGARDAVIRAARPADNAQIAAIWNREVLETAATTDTEPRAPEAQRAWLAAHGARYPVIVAVDGDEVLAFGALTPYRAKPAYARTVEDSVYVKPGWRGKGVGGLVLDRLVALAAEHGHHSIVARITGVNEASLLLHERRGFGRVGLEREVAFKLGAWLDVVTLQRRLGA